MKAFMTHQAKHGTELALCDVGVASSRGMVVALSASYTWQWASQGVRPTVTQFANSQKSTQSMAIQEGAGR
jgi:hypothetical protein